MVLIFVVNLYMYGSHGSHMVRMVLSFVVTLYTLLYGIILIFPVKNE